VTEPNEVLPVTASDQCHIHAAEWLIGFQRRLSSTSLSRARSAFAVVIKGLGVPMVLNTTEAITAPRIGATMKSQS
jgi:hypothetical protein